MVVFIVAFIVQPIICCPAVGRITRKYKETVWAIVHQAGPMRVEDTRVVCYN